MAWKEFAVIAHARAHRADPGGGASVLIPSGDDMAMLRLAGREVLVAVDQTVAGRHFDPAVTPIGLIARKAVHRCVSDVAAMAALPCASLVAGVLPPEMSSSEARSLVEALHVTATAAGAPIIGGDLAMHANAGAPLTLGVTLLAVPGTSTPVRRSGARAGDLVAVTGMLGGSFGADGLGRHLSFTPRVSEAIELARLLGEDLHSMIDVSDGLGRDAGHLVDEASAPIRIVLDEGALPCASGATASAALTDGEDYELLFTCARDAVPPSLVGGSVPITIIGRVEAGAPDVLMRDASGSMRSVRTKGWEHHS